MRKTNKLYKIFGKKIVRARETYAIQIKIRKY